MNKNPGILGLKLGMTQVVAEDGTVTPCTVVQSASVVIGKRSQEKHGYDALILGFGERKARRTNKPLAGQFAAANKALAQGEKDEAAAASSEQPAAAEAKDEAGEGTDTATEAGGETERPKRITPKRVLREFRCAPDFAAKYGIGQELRIEDLFTEGQFVDVRGSSRGRGFSGVMRRHNFSGAGASHGAHEYKRHGGSIGTNMTPGRVKPGVKMAGQHGNRAVSVLNQPIMKLVADGQLILIRGGIPGSRNRVIEVRGAVKKTAQKSA